MPFHRVRGETRAACCQVTTGGATALHVCGMSRAGEMSTALLLEAFGADADVEATDAWGYTPLQRHASNNLAVGAQAGGRPMRSRVHLLLAKPSARVGNRRCWLRARQWTES